MLEYLQGNVQFLSFMVQGMVNSAVIWIYLAIVFFIHNLLVLDFIVCFQKLRFEGQTFLHHKVKMETPILLDRVDREILDL